MALEADAAVDRDHTTTRPEELPIFGEVLQSILDDKPVEDTLNLISRRVSEVAGFKFCAMLLVGAGSEHLRLAGAHNFPRRYADRLTSIFGKPVRDALVGSPTETAVHEGRTTVVEDVFVSEEFEPWRPLAVEFGYGSLISVPLLAHGETIGVMNGYSAERRTFTRHELVTVEALARNAALALRVATLMDSQQDTIAMLRQANEELERHRSVLERAHEIHLRLTSPVIAGATRQAVAQTLSELIGRPVVVLDVDGKTICTSEPPPDEELQRYFEAAFVELCTGPAAHRRTPLEPADRTAIKGRIWIGPEDLGFVLAPAGDPESRDLDIRALEHAATVLALDFAKQRVERATEERLQSDFVADLLEGREDAEPRTAARARHYGLSLGLPHRVLVVALDDWPRYEKLTRLSDAAGSDLRAQIIKLIGVVAGERLPGSLLRQASDAVTVVFPVGGFEDPVAACQAVVAQLRRRIAELAPGLAVTAGIGGAARAAGDFAGSYEEALRCVELLRRLGRGDHTLATDELGVFRFFLETQRPEELTELANQVIGPVLERDAASGGALFQTLESYLDHGCDVRACAADLYVHVNTVKYRLRRIEELCGLDLRRPNDLLHATIARLIVTLVGLAPPRGRAGAAVKGRSRRSPRLRP